MDQYHDVNMCRHPYTSKYNLKRLNIHTYDISSLGSSKLSFSENRMLSIIDYNIIHYFNTFVCKSKTIGFSST